MASSRGPALRRKGPCSLLGVTQIRLTPDVQAEIQQQEQEMGLGAEAARANAPAVKPVGRLSSLWAEPMPQLSSLWAGRAYPCMVPAMHPAPPPRDLSG
eukprot:285629-Pelagomonas_calceolata.AAC.5